MVPPKTTSGVSRAAPQFLSQDRDLHLGVVTPPPEEYGHLCVVSGVSVSLIRFSQARMVPPLVSPKGRESLL